MTLIELLFVVAWEVYFFAYPNYQQQVLESAQNGSH